jgi:hypothetical protein
VGVRIRPAAVLLTLAVLIVAGCDNPPSAQPLVPGQSRVLFRLADGTATLVDARAHGAVVNLSARLHVDGTATMSLNGRYLAVTTADGCAAVSTGDFTKLEKVVANGTCVAPYPESVHLADSGDLLVYNGSGVHQRDLFAVRRIGPHNWSRPANLTGSGPFEFNRLPRLNPDATMVVYDCGNTPDSDENTSICAVGTGTDAKIRTVLAEPVGSGDTAWTSFHSPAYLPTGGLVFECHHPHEELLCSLPSGGSAPQRFTAPGVSNDNSPCAFSDGRVASLLDTGTHTLRLVDAGGAGPVVPYDKQDILDVGIYCGGS